MGTSTVQLSSGVTCKVLIQQISNESIKENFQSSKVKRKCQIYKTSNYFSIFLINEVNKKDLKNYTFVTKDCKVLYQNVEG